VTTAQLIARLEERNSAGAFELLVLAPNVGPRRLAFNGKPRPSSDTDPADSSGLALVLDVLGHPLYVVEAAGVEPASGDASVTRYYACSW